MDKNILKRSLISCIVFLFLSTSCFPFVTASYDVDHEHDLIIDDISIYYKKTGSYIGTKVKDIGNAWERISSKIEVHVKIYRCLFGIPLIPVRSYTIWTTINAIQYIEPNVPVIWPGLYRFSLTVNPHRLIEESNYYNNGYYEDFQGIYGNWYPANSIPKISNPNPSNNQENVPFNISKLSFQIHDDDNLFMDYSVNTDPFIGSGSKNNVVSGVYSISVDGLKHSTVYNWTVTATDGIDTTTSKFKFKTADIVPVISDPNPSDGFTNVFVNQSILSFSIADPQNDLMNYSVETSPYIGSKSETGVPAGRYEIPIYNLNYDTVYSWYVNVTDGTNWKKEKFTFKTFPEDVLIFYPIDDTTISESDPYDIWGSGTSLSFRSFTHYLYYKILIRFDLSQISPNNEILYAKMYLYYYTWKDNNPGGDIMRLYRVLEDWSEDSVNWHNQPSVSNLSSSEIIVPDSPNNWMVWDVTEDVIKFISGDEFNFGWLLKDETNWIYGGDIPVGRFYSKDYNEIDFIPYIEIIIKK